MRPLAPASDERRFYLFDAPWKILMAWRGWIRRDQRRRLPRVAARLLAPYRVMYCVTEGGAILHEGWLVIGRSPLYDVEATDVVFGPISTRANERGRGLAAFGLEQAIDSMVDRGYRTFYIHTRERNAASRRVIDKCGFGPPVERIVMGDLRQASPDLAS